MQYQIPNWLPESNWLPQIHTLPGLTAKALAAQFARWAASHHRTLRHLGQQAAEVVEDNLYNGTDWLTHLERHLQQSRINKHPGPHSYAASALLYMCHRNPHQALLWTGRYAALAHPALVEAYTPLNRLTPLYIAEPLDPK
jgi:hypothetical protein